MDVEIVQMDVPGGKWWVKVTLKKFQSFFPSFEDLHRIIYRIAVLEDKKYPNGQGREMVARFLREACYTKDFEQLKQRYQIPERDSNQQE